MSVGYRSPDKLPQGSASAPLPIILPPVGTHPGPGTVQGPTGEAKWNGLGPCSPGSPRPGMPIEQELQSSPRVTEDKTESQDLVTS